MSNGAVSYFREIWVARREISDASPLVIKSVCKHYKIKSSAFVSSCWLRRKLGCWSSLHRCCYFLFFKPMVGLLMEVRICKQCQCFLLCVENFACLSRLKKIHEDTGNSKQNCLRGLWETINLDQLVKGKNGFKRTAGKQLFCKPKSYRILTPRTVRRLAIRKQYFDRYKSHSRPLRTSLPISGLKRETQTIGRLVPWKLQSVEKKDTKYLLVSR